MSVKFSNNATTELASSIGTSDTSITVVDASKFPILTAGDYTYVTLDTDTASPTREIVKVTAISGNVLTVTRGQDGTSPASFAAGTKVELRLTAALLNDVAGANPSGEPIGFPDKSQTTITFDSGTRTFSITPTGASFDVYCKGIKYTYTAVQLVTIPNTTGLHFIYFSASGVLSTQMSYFTWEEHAPTAYVYWNATTQQAIYFADERHGITLDWQTHEYLHRTRGAAIANGFAASGYTTTGLGATDADAQIDIGGGTFFDEDMQVDIVSTNTPVAGTWQQDLSGPARIPVLYLSGSAWVIDAPTNFPFKVVSSVPQYNLYSGGTWSTASVTNNSYFVSWILATNNLTYPVVSIISQAPTNQVSVAEAMTFEGLNLNGFPSVEFRPLYKVIYQYKDGFANSVKSSTIAVYDLRSISSAGVAAALVQDHGNLSGLTDDDHPQYVHTSEVRTPSAAVKNSFFPSQVGQTGKYLSTDGTNTVWEPAPSGSLSFTGDVTGTGSTGSSVAMTLAASGVVAGQYTKVTVDAKGRVTAGTGVTSSDVTTALGYTPYNATNPAGYTTNVGTVYSVSGTGTVSGLTLTGSVTSSGSLTLGGTLSLTSGQVTSALGFTPYNATNPSGYITSSSNITGTAAGITGYTLADVTGTPTTVMTRNSGGDSAVGSRFHFTTCTADGGNFALVGLNWGGAAGTYKDFEVYDYPNSRPLFRAFGSTRNFEVYGTLTAPNFADSTGTYNVNLGSGGSEGRGLVAGYSGGSYGGIGYNVRHTTTGDSYIAPGGDTSSYLRFAGGGFSFLGAAAGSVGRSLSYTTLASISAAGTFNAVNLTNNGNQVLHAGNYNDYAPSKTGTGASGTWSINITGNAATTSQRNFTGDIASTGQGRFTGWYDGASGNNSLAAEIGVSGGAAYILSYNRGTSSYATLQLAATNIQLVPQGGALTGPGGNVILHAGNYGSGYFKTINGSSIIGTGDLTVSGTDNTKLPLTGGTLTGTIYVGTSGSTSATRALRVGPSGGSPASFGSYAGSWRSTIEIWDNAATRMLHLTPPDGTNYNYSSIKSTDAGLKIDVGGSGGTNAVTFEANGVANFPQGLQQGGNQVLHVGNYGGYSSFSGLVSSSGNNGFANATWFANVRNPIWSFGNASSYGISYFQGSSGRDNTDTITLHPNGATTATGAAFAVNGNNAFAFNNVILHAGNYGSYALPLSGGAVSGTVTFGSFLRIGSDNNSWATGNYFRGASDHFVLGVQSGGTLYLNYGNSAGTTRIEGTTLINGNTALHAGNYTSYSPSLTGSGASGTWGINITGNADTVDSLHASSFSRKDTTNQWLKPYYEYTQYLTSETPANLRDQMSSGGGLRVDFMHPSYTGSGGWNHVITWSGYNLYNMYQLGGHYDGGTGTDLWVRSEANHTGTSWTAWRKLLNSSNYNSYSPTLTGGGASGTWGISISGTASYANNVSNGRFDNYSGSYNNVYTWLQFSGNHGLYWPSSGAGTHFTPQGNTYGSWNTQGHRNTYSGLFYDTNAGINGGWMTNGNATGYYAHSYGWKYLHESGVFYIFSGTYGGGSQYTALHSGNYSSYALPLSGGTVSGSIVASGNITAYSDERLKKDWAVLPENFVERLAGIKSGTFTRIDSGARQAGSSAQDWQKLLPEVVSEESDGTLALAYGNAALVSAVELAKELVMLKKELAEIKSRLH